MSFDVIARVALGQRESRQFDTEMAQLAIESMQKYMNTPFDYVGFVFPGMLRKDPLIILRKQLMDELTARKKLREIGGEQQQQQQRAQVDFIDLFLETEQNEQQQQQTEQCQNEGEAMLSKTALQRVEKQCTLEEIAMQLLMFLLAGFVVPTKSAAGSGTLFNSNAAWVESCLPDARYLLNDLVCINRCVKIEYKGNTLTVPINNKCSECAKDHVDLSEEAFNWLEPGRRIGGSGEKCYNNICEVLTWEYD
ncbi:hypothetical protein niasHS_016772 [Heterodera schachtii]|uniref:Uncharacterized protein n=1 Tax=Heterodera schachtii TaxID=97005 RepID=A0ABD2HVC1_HETSC